ncbi:unnamed protein product [Lampetra planeri]
MYTCRVVLLRSAAVTCRRLWVHSPWVGGSRSLLLTKLGRSRARERLRLLLVVVVRQQASSRRRGGGLCAVVRPRSRWSQPADSGRATGEREAGCAETNKGLNLAGGGHAINAPDSALPCAHPTSKGCAATVIDSLIDWGWLGSRSPGVKGGGRLHGCGEKEEEEARGLRGHMAAASRHAAALTPARHVRRLHRSQWSRCSRGTLMSPQPAACRCA